MSGTNHQIEFNLKEFLRAAAPKTFLVGAGCSIDPPSCLPAGREMITAIIRYSCAKPEVKNLLELKELRFEQIVEIVRDNLDHELKIIDYYGLCDKPNLQHFFFAEMIRKGHFVMTTNFDFLIEFALLHSGTRKDELTVVITKNDFERFSNPSKLFKQGVKALYKIHGSTKNVISGESTRDSLIATLQAFGSGKEGESVFQLEPFKRPLFENISKDHTLVIMGYSGSDDFDVIPTLKILKEVNQIIWLNYVKEDGGKEVVIEIEDKEVVPTTKIEQILVEIKRMGYAKHVFKVDGNTTRIIQSLMENTAKVSNEPFSESAFEWLKKEIPVANEFIQYQIPYQIYEDFAMINDAERCAKTILQLAETRGNNSWKSAALNNIGLLLKGKGDLDGALARYEAALAIDEQLGDLRGKATRLNNIGLLLYGKGDLDGALIKLEKALYILTEIGMEQSQDAKTLKKNIEYIKNLEER